MKELVIYGAGGFAREVLQLATDIEAAGEPWTVAGFLSDDPRTHGTVADDVPVLGDLSFLALHPGRFLVALGVGSPSAKLTLSERIAPLAAGFPPLVHPTVIRSNRITFGSGAIICAGSILTVDIAVSDFVTINLGCTVGHDCRIGSFVTIAPGVNVSGNVALGDGCDIGTGAAIIQGRTIGEWSVVGAGAVVSADLPANCTAVGVPAKSIKQRAPGWQRGGA